MNDHEIICGLKKELVDTPLEGYRRAMDAGSHEGRGAKSFETDVLKFLQDLSPTEKELVIKMIRQVEIDIVATFLAFLDGRFWLEGQDEEVVLTFEDKPADRINVDLSDRFLDLIHKWKV